MYWGTGMAPGCEVPEEVADGEEGTERERVVGDMLRPTVYEHSDTGTTLGV